MANLSQSEIIRDKSIGKGLNAFRDSFNAVSGALDISSSLDALHQMGNEGNYTSVYHIVPLTHAGIQNLALDHISALQILPASRLLPSCSGSKNLFSDLSRLNLAVNSDNFDIERVNSLLSAVLNNESDEVIWKKVYAAVTEFTPRPRSLPYLAQTPYSYTTSSFVNSSEHRKYVDDVLKHELGPLYVGVPGFYEAFFGEVRGLEAVGTAVFRKCKEGDNPLYREEGGWCDWPRKRK